MTSSSEHWEVASYALGVLDDHDMARFEAHLAECDRCAEELESLLPVTGILSYVDPADIGEAEPSYQGEQLLRRMALVVAEERTQQRGRRLLVLAASSVALLMLVGLAFVAGRQAARPAPVAAPPAAAAASQAPATPPATAFLDPGFGGPDVRGERFQTKDTATGLRVDMLLNAQPWGTEVSVALAGLAGPLVECRLVVFDVDGTSTVVATWQVPAHGFGTTAHPAPLLLQAATAWPRKEIDHFEVVSIAPQGVSVTLASVRV